MATTYCKTDNAILLVAVPDDRGVLHFPLSKDAPLPGLHLAVKALLPIFDQLTTLASTTLGQDVARKLHIWDEFADELTLPDGTLATLYVATLSEVPTASAEAWPVMPTILRSMEKNRGRLPYLRAWQILQGGLKLNTKAVDPAEVAKYFDD